MIIEAAGTRLAIDLFESLRKYKFIISDIRVSYISKTGSVEFKTFNTFDDLISEYNTKYNKIVQSRRNPFTKNPKNAQLTPVVKNGIILSGIEEPINSSSIKGLCELGNFISVERFRVSSDTFNYSMVFNCIDVSDTFKIIEGQTRDLRRNIIRTVNTTRHKDAIINFIKTYQTILNRLYSAYNANLYVDLCYVSIGYVEESIKLYSIFFSIVKERLDTGLRLSVLDKVYLKKI
jgi:hypothetical protein